MPLTFDAGPHLYTLDDVVVPSVTAVLRESGLVNFDNIPPSQLEAARTRGTIVHQAIHYYNEHDLDVGGFAQQFPDYAGYLEGWIRLMDTGRLKTALCEHRVASRRHQVAGTIDWLGEFDGHGALIDFATGDPEDAAKDLQTAAYAVLAREWAREPGLDALAAFMAAHPYVRRYSVRLKKTGVLPTPQPYTSVKDTIDFITLLSAQRVVKVRKPKAVDWTEWAA